MPSGRLSPTPMNADRCEECIEIEAPYGTSRAHRTTLVVLGVLSTLLLLVGAVTPALSARSSRIGLLASSPGLVAFLLVSSWLLALVSLRVFTDYRFPTKWAFTSQTFVVSRRSIGDLTIPWESVRGVRWATGGKVLGYSRSVAIDFVHPAGGEATADLHVQWLTGPSVAIVLMDQLLANVSPRLIDARLLVLRDLAVRAQTLSVSASPLMEGFRTAVSTFDLPALSSRTLDLRGPAYTQLAVVGAEADFLLRRTAMALCRLASLDIEHIDEPGLRLLFGLCQLEGSDRAVAIRHLTVASDEFEGRGAAVVAHVIERYRDGKRYNRWMIP